MSFASSTPGTPLDLFPPEIWSLIFEKIDDFASQTRLLASSQVFWQTPRLHQRISQLAGPSCPDCGLNPVEARQQFWALEQLIQDWFKQELGSQPDYWLPMVTSASQTPACVCSYCRDYTQREILSHLLDCEPIFAIDQTTIVSPGLKHFILSLSSVSIAFSKPPYSIVGAIRFQNKKLLCQFSQQPVSEAGEKFKFPPASDGDSPFFQLWVECLTYDPITKEIKTHPDWPAMSWDQFQSQLKACFWEPYDLSRLTTYTQYLEGAYHRVK